MLPPFNMPTRRFICVTFTSFIEQQKEKEKYNSWVFRAVSSAHLSADQMNAIKHFQLRIDIVKEIFPNAWKLSRRFHLRRFPNANLLNGILQNSVQLTQHFIKFRKASCLFDWLRNCCIVHSDISLMQSTDSILVLNANAFLRCYFSSLIIIIHFWWFANNMLNIDIHTHEHPPSFTFAQHVIREVKTKREISFIAKLKF